MEGYCVVLRLFIATIYFIERQIIATMINNKGKIHAIISAVFLSSLNLNYFFFVQQALYIHIVVFHFSSQGKKGTKISQCSSLFLNYV